MPEESDGCEREVEWGQKIDLQHFLVFLAVSVT